MPASSTTRRSCNSPQRPAHPWRAERLDEVGGLALQSNLRFGQAAHLLRQAAVRLDARLLDLADLRVEFLQRLAHRLDESGRSRPAACRGRCARLPGISPAWRGARLRKAALLLCSASEESALNSFANLGLRLVKQRDLLRRRFALLVQPRLALDEFLPGLRRLESARAESVTDCSVRRDSSSRDLFVPTGQALQFSVAVCVRSASQVATPARSAPHSQ